MDKASFALQPPSVGRRLQMVYHQFVPAVAAVLTGAILTGCAGVDVQALSVDGQTPSGRPGLRYYMPRPYLLVTRLPADPTPAASHDGATVAIPPVGSTSGTTGAQPGATAQPVAPRGGRQGVPRQAPSGAGRTSDLPAAAHFSPPHWSPRCGCRRSWGTLQARPLTTHRQHLKLNQHPLPSVTPASSTQAEAIKSSSSTCLTLAGP